MKRILLAALAAFCILVLDSADSPAQAVGGPGSWTVNSTPAVNTQASASRAAQTGKSHVSTSCSGSINTVAAQGGITLSLRDGATGAGTVLWSQTVACPIGAWCVVTSPIVAVPGTLSTAMTCEWSGIPAVGNFEVATLTGFDAG